MLAARVCLYTAGAPPNGGNGTLVGSGWLSRGALAGFLGRLRRLSAAEPGYCAAIGGGRFDVVYLTNDRLQTFPVVLTPWWPSTGARATCGDVSAPGGSRHLPDDHVNRFLFAQLGLHYPE